MTTLTKRIINLLAILLIGIISISVRAQNTSTERIYIQTDRTVYIAGETMYYKLYLLDARTQKRSDYSKFGYIVLRDVNQNPVLKCRIKIESGISWGNISLPDTLSSGVYQIVAFTSLMKNDGEQYFFHNEIIIINSFDKDFNFKLPTTNIKFNYDSIDNSVKVTTDKEKYSPLQKVVVHIGNSNIKANLSVSVYEDSNIKTSSNSITDVFNKSKTKITNKPLTTDYLSEQTGKIIRGKVLDSVTGLTISHATVLLSCIDTVANLQYAITNSSGIFQMQLSDYYDGKELFFTIREMPENQHWKIEIEDEFALATNWKPTLQYDNGTFKDFFVKSKDIAYVTKSYQKKEDTLYNTSPKEEILCPQLYFCPSKTVLLSDYSSLNDFKEIVVELFPEIRITKENGKNKVTVLNGSQKMFSNEDIAIFLDGVYVDDVDKIMKLGSELIKKIDVLNTERVFGNLVYRGLISIITKSTEIEKTIPSAYSLRIKNDKICNTDDRIGEKPDTISDKRFPFFKQLIYWNPNIELNGQKSTSFDFLTSENEGNFMLKIEGISDDGRPISYSTHIQVIK